MPLVLDTLTDQMRRIMDTEYTDGGDPPQSLFVANDPAKFDFQLFPTEDDRFAEFKRRISEEPEFLADLWADAYDAYCSLVAVGGPATNAPLAKEAMKAELLKVFDPDQDGDFEASFYEYTSALVFVAHSAEATPPIPPTGPAMATVAAEHGGGPPASNQAAAEAMARVVDIWTKTNNRANDVSGSPVPFA
jgi:hypothetical protein